MACRDPARGEAAARRLGLARRAGAGEALVKQLDLSDFESVSHFTAGLDATSRINALVANAAIMGGPRRSNSAGIELQMATNHFGHALLTALLLPCLSPEGRLVVVSSLAARRGKLGPALTAEELTSPQPYSPDQVYANTKQANLLFAVELQRRLAKQGSAARSLAAHPGVSATELAPRQMREEGRSWMVPLARPVMRLILQPAAHGAWPVLRALADPDLSGGELVGPGGIAQIRGRPVVLPMFPQGADPVTARRLFAATEEVLGRAIVEAAP
jgi:protochlorophyllide reductase